MSGGYSQQGYQARPPSSRAPPPHVAQQPAYGYQQPRPGYPPLQQPSGGYLTNWDHSNAPPLPPQQPAHGLLYDYSAHSKPPSFCHNQPGPGYAQDDVYAGYQAPPQSSGDDTGSNLVPWGHPPMSSRDMITAALLSYAKDPLRYQRIMPDPSYMPTGPISNCNRSAKSALDDFNERHKEGVQYRFTRVCSGIVCPHSEGGFILMQSFEAQPKYEEDSPISYFYARLHFLKFPLAERFVDDFHVSDCELCPDPTEIYIAKVGCRICGLKDEVSHRMGPFRPRVIRRKIKAKSEDLARKFFVCGILDDQLTEENENTVTTLNKAEVPGEDVVEVVVRVSALLRRLLRPDFHVAESCFNHCYNKVGWDGLFASNIPWFITGHSVNKSIEVVGNEVEHALSMGMSVIACVWETLEQREAGTTLAVVSEQTRAIAAKISSWDNVVLAYAPVWSIGTGKVATPAQPQEVHAGLRKWVQDNVSADVAASLRIIYGGSVNRENCKAFAAQPDIDGFFIMDATSMKGDEFIGIINSATVKIRKKN